MIPRGLGLTVFKVKFYELILMNCNKLLRRQDDYFLVKWTETWMTKKSVKNFFLSYQKIFLIFLSCQNKRLYSKYLSYKINIWSTEKACRPTPGKQFKTTSHHCRCQTPWTPHTLNSEFQSCSLARIWLKSM